MFLQNVPPGTHMCLILSDHHSALKEIAAFIVQAVQNRGSAHYFIGDHLAEEVRHEVGKCGCSVTEDDEVLHFSQAKEVYTPEGVFDRERMKRVLAENYDADSNKHGGPVHYVGDMEWALEHGDDVMSELIRYEREVNAVCKTHPFSAVCRYDAAKFDPDVLLEIMKVHPYLLIDGMVVQSPYYEETIEVN